MDESHTYSQDNPIPSQVISNLLNTQAPDAITVVVGDSVSPFQKIMHTGSPIPKTNIQCFSNRNNISNEE